jgi:dihydrofolate reductase
MEKDFSIIVAVDEKMGIGRRNTLPWKLSADMQHFKELTIAPAGAPRNVVIMGRKTWESLPAKFRPLPDRINVVLTHNEELPLPDGVLKFASLQAALEAFQAVPAEGAASAGSVFVIGGAQLFNEAIRQPSCKKLYITFIADDFSCDVFFPEIPSNFKVSSKTEVLSENGLDFYFSEYAISS